MYLSYKQTHLPANKAICGSNSDRGTSRDCLFAKPVSFIYLVLPHSIVGDKRSDHKDNKLVCFH